MKKKTKKVWSQKCDKTLVGMEESAEAVIQKCFVNKIYFKGYLCYKTITSQNVPSKAQIKDFFIS